MDTAESLVPRDFTDCPVDRMLRVIGGRWKPVILYQLRAGSCRFNALRRLIPTITQRMLTQHLRALEADGIISRHIHRVEPPRVDHALTSMRQGRMPVMQAMAIWGVANLAPQAKAAA